MMKVQDGVELYVVQGQALDNAWIARNREMLEDHAIEDMRAGGLIPVLDVAPSLTSDFDPETETFTFKVSIYGYRVGDKSYDLLGILSNEGILVYKDLRRVAFCDADEI